MSSKVIVIGTHHREGGACTSDVLVKVIQKISPNVIFFEAPPVKFPAMLKATETFNPPEIKALRTIIEKQLTDVVPVDLDEDPFDRRLEAMHELFRANPEYFCASEIHAGETYQKGFPYLNDDESDQIFKDKNLMEKIFVEKANHSELSRLYFDWLEWNDKREDNWISVIHNRFMSGGIKSAVFLVGSAHRIRLMERVKKLEGGSYPIPVWDFYPFKQQDG